MPLALPSVALVLALAPPAGGQGNAAIEASPTSAATQGAVAASPRPKLSRRTQTPWIRRWAPERNTVELGVYGGIFIPARDLELFEPDPLQPRQGFRPLAKVAPDFGVRAAYLPSRFFGL